MIKGSVLITGGMGGIGTSIVEILSKQEINCITIDSKSNRELFKNEVFLEIDLNFPERIGENSNFLNKNILNFIHCAGYGGPYVDIVNLREVDFFSIFNINIFSAYFILKELLPDWKKNNYGRFLGIASSLSIVGAKNSVAYSSSKHALVGFVKSIGAEWGEFGITSNSISPGYVDTKMGVQEGEVNDHKRKIIEMTPSAKISQPGEIARVVNFILDTESSYINCSNWTVDGGITAI
jgi:NAD(P)-dependent dehydrogenase (short-subunit alcohol dehydrogenase family)